MVPPADHWDRGRVVRWVSDMMDVYAAPAAFTEAECLRILDQIAATPTRDAKLVGQAQHHNVRRADLVWLDEVEGCEWVTERAIDLVRVAEDQFYVLEDNARTPSGVSYMLENRETMLQMFPELFGRIKVRGVGDYPLALRRSLGASMPRHASGDGAVAVLTPGIHNSAYFEHAFLADHMGVELVEGSDLRVVDGRVDGLAVAHHRRLGHGHGAVSRHRHGSRPPRGSDRERLRHARWQLPRCPRPP